MKRGKYIRSLEIREKQRDSMTGKNIGVKRPAQSIAMQGENNPMWGKKRSIESRQKQSAARLKNSRGFITTEEGYVKIPVFDHPMKTCGYVAEHRLIIEKLLGRYLEKSEVVHHIDRDKANNNPKNLMAFSSHSAHIQFERSGNVKSGRIIFDGRSL